MEYSQALLRKNRIFILRCGDSSHGSWHDSNGKTDVRDRYGNLQETRTYHKNGIVDVRDKSGSLIGTERRTGH